ncbi:MAG: hypothetical protein GEV07_03965 [Streptosporangiales bacterium]|nr:hypothetical protein [Streptosporangiales bacterium]
MPIHQPVARETLVRRVQLAAAGTPHRINPTASGFDLTVYAPDGASAAAPGTGRAKVVHHVHVDELAGTVSVTDEVGRAGRREPLGFGVSWSAKRGRRKSLRLTLGPSGARARSFDRQAGRRIVLETATALGWHTSY